MKKTTTENHSLATLKAAGTWASKYLDKKVSESNISYLVQYGKIRKIKDNGSVFVNLNELKNYYDQNRTRPGEWQKKLGADLNWHLSFDYLREKDTTKHVHRLHPYKGKFIPQLVEYFIDEHVDEFKKETYFKPGDIILDPFCGSGTTLVQASESRLHAVGVDISHFNTLIANAKIAKYDYNDLEKQLTIISEALQQFVTDSRALKYEKKVSQALSEYNAKFFPGAEIKLKFNTNALNEQIYGAKKERDFLKRHELLLTEVFAGNNSSSTEDTFLEKWYMPSVRAEIEFVRQKIDAVQNPITKRILKLILSRTIRSCRATTHFDLATLKNPVFNIYYCHKHKKICKPVFTILRWWEIYAKDSLARLLVFKNLRSNTRQVCLNGDARTIDLLQSLAQQNPALGQIAQKNKISGIFSSPPYVGLIDYHDQHAYAYEVFNLPRQDKMEIGPLFKGKGKEAQASYVKGIAEVLQNSRKFLKENFNIFLVANDRFDLYPEIARMARLKIVNQFKRPVLNRTERDKNAYAEVIFHLKA